MKPMRGAIALNENGALGIITSAGRVLVHFDNGSQGMAFVGIVLHTGGVWASPEPTVIAETFDAFLEEQHQRVAIQAARDGLREHFAAKIGGA